MLKEPEKLLEEYKKNTYDDIIIPDNIDVFIEKGIQQRNADRKVQWRKKSTAIAACFVVIAFLTAIRISPTFASYINDIPGLDYIVRLINFDRGLQLALENDFIQLVDISDTHEDITITVDSIIADESRMVIFYTVESKGNYKGLRLIRAALKNENGEDLPVSISYGGFTGIDFSEKPKNEQQIDVSFGTEVNIPDTITLEVKIAEEKQTWEEYRAEHGNYGNSIIDDSDRFMELEAVWKIDIPIDKERFEDMKEVYPINKAISVKQQNIYVQQFMIYPTRMELDIAYDENNPLKIFSIENLRITDEKGEWKAIANGITASHLDENTRRYYFQSGYFTYPKELYVEGDGIYALENEQLEVVVDLENERLIKAPDDKMKLEDIEEQQDYYILHFKVPQYDNMSHYVFDFFFRDSSGLVESIQTGLSVPGRDGYDDYQYYIPKTVDKHESIRIKLVHYPNLIKAPFKLRIK